MINEDFYDETELDVNGDVIINDDVEFLGVEGPDATEWIDFTTPTVTEGRGTELTTLGGTVEFAEGETLWINNTAGTMTTTNGTDATRMYVDDSIRWGTELEAKLSDNSEISHKFRWVKEDGKKVLQCKENGGWVTIPFIEDPDAENYTEEINDLCTLD